MEIQFKFIRKMESEIWKVWQYDNEIDFAHALVGAKLVGQNAFVCGVRRKDCELFVVTYEDGEYRKPQWSIKV